MYVFTDAETEDVDTGDVDSGNSTSHSPAEDKNSLMLTTSSYTAATEGRLIDFPFCMPNFTLGNTMDLYTCQIPRVYKVGLLVNNSLMLTTSFFAATPAGYFKLEN